MTKFRRSTATGLGAHRQFTVSVSVWPVGGKSPSREESFPAQSECVAGIWPLAVRERSAPLHGGTGRGRVAAGHTDRSGRHTGIFLGRGGFGITYPPSRTGCGTRSSALREFYSEDLVLLEGHGFEFRRGRTRKRTIAGGSRSSSMKRCSWPSSTTPTSSACGACSSSAKPPNGARSRQGHDARVMAARARQPANPGRTRPRRGAAAERPRTRARKTARGTSISRPRTS